MKRKCVKWIFSVFALVIVFIITLSSVVYIVDPFFQFRAKDNTYFISVQFCGSGLIKNYDYDTLILGSSMTQNFDMEIFREMHGGKPLLIGIGGLNLKEKTELLNIAYQADRADTYYVCVDLYQYTNDDESHNPQYLLKEDFLSRCRYFLNYEAWFHFIPIDLGMMAADKLGVHLPESIQAARRVDNIDNWESYFTFGEEEVLNNYYYDAYGVSDVDTNDLYNQMTQRIDTYFDSLQPDKGEHILFFPPYSMLYWASRSEEFLSIMLDAKKYYIEKAFESGIKVFDFQTAEFTADLNYYKDLTHYSGEINDWMTEQFALDEYVLTKDNYMIYLDELQKKASDFKENRAELFR